MAYVFLSFTVCFVLYFDTAVTLCLRNPKDLINEEIPISPERNDDGHFYQMRDCEWLIKAPTEKLIMLKFDQVFDIPKNNNLYCDNTYVRVFDGNETDSLKSRGRYCGSTAPQMIISSSNKLLVEFRSAKTATTGKGFTATFKFVSASSLEFRIFRDEKTWNAANDACRNKSGFLVSMTDQNRVKIQQQMRDNESVWSGAFSVWMWTRKCYRYTIKGSYRKFNFTRNSASRCQRRCETDQVWLQGRSCLCNINIHEAELTKYEHCNETCPGDFGDVCGGPGTVMHYETWKGYPELSEDINVNRDCVYITPKTEGSKWHTDMCNVSYLPLCKYNDEMDASYDNYFIPSVSYQKFATYDIQSLAVERCINNKSMIADISGKKKLTSVNTYLDNTEGLPSDAPQLWIGLKRKREKVTKYKTIIPEAHTNFSCYFIHHSPIGTSKEMIGSCKKRMAYVCKLPVERSNPQQTTSASDFMSSRPTSTMTSESDVTPPTSPDKEQSTFTSSQDSTIGGGKSKEEKAQTSETVLIIGVAAAGGFLLVVIIIAIVCIKKRRRKSNEGMVKFNIQTRRTYDYTTTEDLMEIHNIKPERKTNDCLETKSPPSFQNEDDVNDHYDVANGGVMQTDESTEDELKGSNPLAQKNNSYLHKQHSDNVHYNELSVGNKSKPEVNEYSLNQPDDGTYNVLSDNKRKSNNADDVSDMYDHTCAEKMYNELNTGGNSKQKWNDVEGVYDHANDFESEYNELSLDNSAKKVAVLDDTYDHTNNAD